MKNFQTFGVNLFWKTIIVFFAVCSIIALIAILLGASFKFLFITVLVVTSIFGVSLLIKGIYLIPTKYESILLKFNIFNEVLKEGFVFIYPLFGIYSLAKDNEGDIILYSTAIDSLSLLEMEEIKEDQENNDFSNASEFKDGQAWVLCDLTYQVVDSKLAYSHRQNFEDDILAKYRELLNNQLKGKMIDNLLQSSVMIDLAAIDPKLPGIENYQEKYLREDGVKIIDFRLQDIVLSRETSKAREEILKSLIEKDIAKNKAKVISILAVANMKATENAAQAWIDAVEKLVHNGLDGEQAEKLLEAHIKWDTVEKSEKIKWEAFKNAKEPSLIIGSSDAMMGSAASAGFKKSGTGE